MTWALIAVALVVGGFAIRSTIASSTSSTTQRGDGASTKPAIVTNPPQEGDIELLVKAWNDAHASKNEVAFASLYADSVLYYGSQQSRDACVAGKRAFLNKNPDFRQEIVGNIRVDQDTDDARATFLKHVLFHGQTTDYPSYLAFKRSIAGWQIATEGDTVTDANLAKRAATPAVPPPDGIPARLYRDDALAISAKSKFGRFEMIIDRTPIASSRDPLCRVVFHRPSGGAVPLFVADLCYGKHPTSDQVGATERIGEVRFPAVDKEGHELHVLEIASARGGNASDRSDYWVVTISADNVWTSPMFQSQLTRAWLLRVSPLTLMLEEPATTTSAGVRYSASFGSLQKVDLPMLPSSVVSKGRRELIGDLRGGFHATNGRPLIETDGESLVIDEDGQCSLPEPGEARGRVRLWA